MTQPVNDANDGTDQTHLHGAIQHMEQATMHSTDAWEAFYSICWDVWEELQRNRAVKHQAGTSEPVHDKPTDSETTVNA